MFYRKGAKKIINVYVIVIVIVECFYLQTGSVTPNLVE